jgi:hypothetical protein
MYIEGQLPRSQAQITESYLGADGSIRTLIYPVILTRFNVIFRSVPAGVFQVIYSVGNNTYSNTIHISAFVGFNN